MIVKYNIAPDTRSWWDRLCGEKRPVSYSCDMPGEQLLLMRENQNKENAKRWGGKIGNVYFPRKIEG